MDISQSVDSLHQLQTTYPEIFSFALGDVSLWPTLRYNELERFKYQRYNQSNIPRRASMPQHGLKRTLYSALLGRRLNNAVSKRKEKSIGFLSMSPSYYSERMDGKQYNRHIDPFIDRIKVLDPGTGILKIHGEESKPPFYYDAEQLPTSLIKALAHYKRVPFSLDLDREEHLRSIVEQFGLEDILDRSIADLEQIHAESQVARIVLERLNLSALFVVCFYDLNIWPFVIAANRLGIPVIDIQHGKQGSIHHMYSHNTGITEMSAMYPTHFWNWGHPSAQSICSWFGQSEGSPRCIEGGNLFTQKWIHEDFYQPEADEKRYEAQLTAHAKYFLYCDAPMTETLPEIILETARNHPDHFFGIRLHPARRNKLSVFEQEVQGISNIEIKVSSEAPLYWLLKKCDGIITPWSSVCVEGVQFNCPTILIHENGAKLYPSYIEKGWFHLAYTSEELGTKCLELSKDSITMEDDFILTDRDHSSRVLLELLRSIEHRQ